MKHFLAAFRFLTIIPLPGTYGSSADDLKGALPFFPVVGIMLGIVSGAIAWLLWQVFPPIVAAVLVTFVLLSFSGGLHLDGLADCADGCFSARDRAKILEIMRDSRIGVMGVIALVMVLLLKVAAMSELAGDSAVRAALLMPLAGRSALVMMIFLLPYVRKDGGMGTVFYAQRNGWSLALALFVLFGAAFTLIGANGLIVGIFIIFIVFLFSRFCHRKIGGATGDTLGAACEIVESVVPFFFLIHFS